MGVSVLRLNAPVYGDVAVWVSGYSIKASERKETEHRTHSRQQDLFFM